MTPLHLRHRRGRTGRDTRRFLTVIQDERGYPGPGQLDPAPPDGPKPPMMLQVVKADDYEALLREHFALVSALRQAGASFAAIEAWARKEDEGTGIGQPHLIRNDAERARDRILAVLAEHAREDD